MQSRTTFNAGRATAAGGTGLRPVQSGVAPDCGGTYAHAFGGINLVSDFTPQSFGRDARNHRRDAGATGCFA